ncbi:hypothetical protein EV356DRAFT_566835 [Viridothelium virens]|uniref:Uncharacterized protein n=1 Tax=Viridothelium virens TaxID=1048519 RepID=A0A6A6H9V1_VIRVR|nr:hypothetical protein EV356DRAFT_566835 [Viridothelium virens]
MASTAPKTGPYFDLNKQRIQVQDLQHKYFQCGLEKSSLEEEINASVEHLIAESNIRLQTQDSVLFPGEEKLHSHSLATGPGRPWSMNFWKYVLASLSIPDDIKVVLDHCSEQSGGGKDEKFDAFAGTARMVLVIHHHWQGHWFLVCLRNEACRGEKISTLQLLDPTRAYRSAENYSLAYRAYKDRLNGNDVTLRLAEDFLDFRGYALPRDDSTESGTVTYWNLCCCIGVLPEDTLAPSDWNTMRLHALLQIRSRHLPVLTEAIKNEQARKATHPGSPGLKTALSLFDPLEIATEDLATAQSAREEIAPVQTAPVQIAPLEIDDEGHLNDKLQATKVVDQSPRKKRKRWQ